MIRQQSFFLRLLSSTWFIILEILLLLSLLFSLIKQINRGYTLRQQQAELGQNLTAEQQKQIELQKLITVLQSPITQEKKIREQLGLQKAGEKVLVIDESSLKTGNTDDVAPGLSSNWQNWWKYFESTD